MITVKVAGRNEEAEGVVSFTLRAANDFKLPTWEPGSHIDVHIIEGEEGDAYVRQYSLTGRPGSDEWLIAVLKDRNSRGGSVAMHANIEVDQELQVSEPRNNFLLHDDGSPAVLIGGGIGVTPLIPMAWSLYEQGIPFRFLYQYRSEQTAAFVDYLRQAPFANFVTFGVDGCTNLNDNLRTILAGLTREAHVYTCGPSGFIESTEVQSATAGLSSHHIHKELFSPAPFEVNDDDEEFELFLAQSGYSVVIPVDKTVAQILEEVGVELPISCEQGMCGSCLTKVIEGEPDHRDTFLTPEEQKRGDYFMPCCSRSKSKILTVDL